MNTQCNTAQASDIKVSVQPLNRKRYEQAPSGQRAFFDKLIAEGRMRFEDEPITTQAAPSVLEEPKQIPFSPINRFIGKRVRITFVGEDAHLDCVLASVWLYELIVTDGVRDITLFKHAVKTMETI